MLRGCTNSLYNIANRSDFKKRDKLPLGAFHFVGRRFDQVDGMPLLRRDHLHRCDAAALLPNGLT